MRRRTMLAIMLLTGGCARELPPPPPHVAIDGLPLTGSTSFARARGFATCVDFNNNLRCRREGVRFLGQGPFAAAVDARGRDGRGGFEQLTLWRDGDQNAIMAVGDRLVALGWSLCRTGQADRGDQFIYRRPGARFRVSIDASYWGKRRARLLPERGQPTGKCW